MNSQKNISSMYPLIKNSISHMGFIMDGNRRYAKENNLPLSQGYEAGMLTFYNTLIWQVKNNIKTTTFFALSLDNSKKRDKTELETIKKIVTKLLNDSKFEKFCKENCIKIQIKGRYFKDNCANQELIKEDSKIFKTTELIEMKKNEEELIRDVERRIKELNNSLDEAKFIVNIALFYDGQDEIATACQEISKLVQKGELEISQITPEKIKQHLYFNDSNSPQIIIRTGKAPRLSGFMLFDSAYSELYLSQKFWPEVDDAFLDDVIKWYSGLKRNFGK